MSVPRLQQFWPLLAKGIETSNPAARSARAAVRIRALHSATRWQYPDAIQQRYGTAHQPPPHLDGSQSATNTALKKPEPNASQTTAEASTVKEQKEPAKSNKADANAQEDKTRVQQKSQPTVFEETTASKSSPKLSTDGKSAASVEASGAPPTNTDKSGQSLLDQVPDPGKASQAQNALAVIVEAASSPTERGFASSAPHINTPPYVHHFDTYSLVRRLEDSGWSNSQSVTIMKAVRLMLTDNMELAKDALVSKSQVENEVYLFRAACAELKTEVTTRRKSEQEKMRTERTQLQHELDILSQRLGQESAAMKDELKGMFDDRKMAVRNEQRGMESKVQRLNYKITVDLQADAKSDVEGLRWVMTRRVIIALGVVTIMVLGSLKLYSNAVHSQDLEAKRKANSRSNGSQTDGPDSGDGGYREHRSIGGSDMVVKEGDNPAFVSLG